MGKIQEYEYTPTQMAEKLLEFNRDFSDSAEDIQNEKEHVTELFEKLQNSNEFNILAHYLDTMFMDNEGYVTDVGAIPVSLIDKAKEDLKEW